MAQYVVCKEAKRLGEEVNMAQIKEAWGDDEELLRRVQSGSSQMAMLYTRNSNHKRKQATHNYTPTNTHTHHQDKRGRRER